MFPSTPWSVREQGDPAGALRGRSRRGISIQITFWKQKKTTKQNKTQETIACLLTFLLLSCRTGPVFADVWREGARQPNPQLSMTSPACNFQPCLHIRVTWVPTVFKWNQSLPRGPGFRYLETLSSWLVFVAGDENLGAGRLFRPHPGQERELTPWDKIIFCSVAGREKWKCHLFLGFRPQISARQFCLFQGYFFAPL